MAEWSVSDCLAMEWLGNGPKFQPIRLKAGAPATLELRFNRNPGRRPWYSIFISTLRSPIDLRFDAVTLQPGLQLLHSFFVHVYLSSSFPRSPPALCRII